jgi:hypothetical protein
MSEVHVPPPDIHEIVRWGDRKTFSLIASDANVPQSTQLLKVHRPVPETWTVTLYAFLEAQPATGPTFDVTCFFDLIIGSGSAIINLMPQIRMQAAAAGVVQTYNSLLTPLAVGFLTFELPAGDIQVQCTSAINNGGSLVQGVDVAALAAPRFIPPNGSQVHREHPWMPPGFHPEQLRYR